MSLNLKLLMELTNFIKNDVFLSTYKYFLSFYLNHLNILYYYLNTNAFIFLNKLLNVITFNIYI